MSTAADVIRRGLRLINVPGRGALLSAADSEAAFVVLREILASEAVGRAIQPGIRRHFFALTAGVSEYSYGPDADLDTTPFGDPAPIGVEDAYVRLAGSIIDEELVANGTFAGASSWTLGGAWAVVNNTARITAGNAGDVLSQAITLAARTYDVRVTVRRRAGSVVVGIVGTGGSLAQTISASGAYTFQLTPTGGVTAITFTPDAAADLDVSFVSVRPEGLDRLRLEAGVGTDYPLRAAAQRTFNGYSYKGAGGQPRAFIFSRSYPDASIRFDHAAAGGEILVVDARVNLADVASLASEVRLHPDAVKWLAYRLAYEVAAEYGKQLAAPQVAIMNEAYSAMGAANARPNTLRVDPALAGCRGRYNIDTD